MSSPRAIVLTRNERITDDLIAAFTAIFCRCTDTICLHGTRRVLTRTNNCSAIHSIVARHRDNAMFSDDRLIASDLLTLGRQVTPKSRLEARSLSVAIESMWAGAWVDGRWADVCCVLKIFDCAEGDRCQWFAVDDCCCAEKRRRNEIFVWLFYHATQHRVLVSL